jgi:predicted lipid-binding transport protein (Tim44 family)
MGSSFQFFDIILFAMIAVFLILRLRSVLGRRHDGSKTGHRDPFARLPDREQPDKPSDGKVVQPPSPLEPRPIGADGPTVESETTDPVLAQGYENIRAADRGFDPREFAAGSQAAFEMILNAYAAGDSKTLQPLLSEEVFGNFDLAIRERGEQGQALEETLVGIKLAEVVEAWMDGDIAHVTVKFVSKQVHVVCNKEGRVIEGDPNQIIDVTDFWTFARDTCSRDPNWALIATRSLD